MAENTWSELTESFEARDQYVPEKYATDWLTQTVREGVAFPEGRIFGGTSDVEQLKMWTNQMGRMICDQQLSQTQAQDALEYHLATLDQTNRERPAWMPTTMSTGFYNELAALGDCAVMVQPTMPPMPTFAPPAKKGLDLKTVALGAGAALGLGMLLSPNFRQRVMTFLGMGKKKTKRRRRR